jgi:Flp pilus assembly protein TadG
MSAGPVRARLFARSDRGSALVEAAFIIPLFMALLLGSLESFHVFRASQMTIRAATTSVDLTTRVREIDDAMEESIYKAAVAVTGSYGDALKDFTVVISSISFSEADDEFALEWSLSNVAGKEMVEEEVEDLDLPELDDGQTVVVVTVSANYHSFLVLDLFDGKKLSAQQIRRPRFGVRVADSTT